ncbi:MAG TPA: MraY family glycosyltransferase, partial [bacterium]|nr:MraY family glycosyltransferase [bacterium]
MWNFVTEIAYYGAISLLVSVSLFYPVKQLAKKFNLMDLPDPRKIHKKPTPRIGGVMIFVSFLLVYLIARKHSIVMPVTSFSKIWLLVAVCGSFLLGLVDDIKNIRAYKKLFFQFLIGFIVAYAGLRIQTITVLSYKIDFGIFSYLITALWVTALLNAVNLIDG